MEAAKGMRQPKGRKVPAGASEGNAGAGAGKTSPAKKSEPEIEAEIEALENRIAEIDLEMSASSSDYLLLDRLFEEKRKLSGEIDRLLEELI